MEKLIVDEYGETEVHGRVVGGEQNYVTVAGRPGDTLTVALEPSNQALYFEVLRSEKGVSMFDAGASGVHRWEGGLPAEELYLIRVYLYPSAVRYNERSDYLLHVDLQPPMLSGRPLR